MKTYNLGLLILLLVATITNALLVRKSRDVSELASPAYDYLPPNVRLALPESETTAAVVTTTEIVTEIPTTIAAITTAPEISASVRGANGYEYRTVRRLKYRHRTLRDVSHLLRAQPDQHYLPPPPPKSDEPSLPQPTVDDDLSDSEVVEAPAFKITDEYLPPAAEDEVASATEATPQPIVVRETENEQTEAPQDTAVLAADGYHYKQPEVRMEIEPALKKTAEFDASEYLPPLANDVVATPAGSGEETAVMANDGYHYRAIKRLRF